MNYCISRPNDTGDYFASEHVEKPPRYVPCLPRPFHAEHHRQLVCVPSQHHQKWHTVTYMTPTSTIRTQKTSSQPTLTNPDERLRERLAPRTRTPTFQHCFFPSHKAGLPPSGAIALTRVPQFKKSANKHLCNFIEYPPNRCFNNIGSKLLISSTKEILVIHGGSNGAVHAGYTEMRPLQSCRSYVRLLGDGRVVGRDLVCMCNSDEVVCCGRRRR
jgi:hypothetical protein